MEMEKKVEQQEQKKLVAQRKLEWEEVTKKLPKIACNLVKTTSKKGDFIYQVVALLQDNIKFKFTIDEITAEGIRLKNNLEYFNKAYERETKRFIGYIQFGSGISQNGNSYKAFTLYVDNRHRFEKLLNDDEFDLICEATNKRGLIVKWYDYENNDFEIFNEYEMKE